MSGSRASPAVCVVHWKIVDTFLPRDNMISLPFYYEIQTCFAPDIVVCATCLRYPKSGSSALSRGLPAFLSYLYLASFVF